MSDCVRRCFACFLLRGSSSFSSPEVSFFFGINFLLTTGRGASVGDSGLEWVLLAFLDSRCVFRRAFRSGSRNVGMLILITTGCFDSTASPIRCGNPCTCSGDSKQQSSDTGSAELMAVFCAIDPVGRLPPCAPVLVRMRCAGFCLQTAVIKRNRLRKQARRVCAQ
jgi:hypothetical protein